MIQKIYSQHVVILSGICLFRMLVEHPVALARPEKNLKRTSLGSPFRLLGCSKGCLADIQRIGPMSEVDIHRTDLCYVGCAKNGSKSKSIKPGRKSYSARTLIPYPHPRLFESCSPFFSPFLVIFYVSKSLQSWMSSAQLYSSFPQFFQLDWRSSHNQQPTFIHLS